MVAGGIKGWPNIHSSVLTLLPGAAAWTSLESLPQPLYGAKASIVGGRIRLTGGFDGVLRRSEVSYDSKRQLCAVPTLNQNYFCCFWFCFDNLIDGSHDFVVQALLMLKLLIRYLSIILSLGTNGSISEIFKLNCNQSNQSMPLSLLGLNRWPVCQQVKVTTDHGIGNDKDIDLILIMVHQ